MAAEQAPGGGAPEENLGDGDQALLIELEKNPSITHFRDDILKRKPIQDRHKVALYTAKKALISIISQRDWRLITDEQELVSFRDLSRQFGHRIVSLEVLEAFFGNATVRYNFSPQIMQLIAYGRSELRAKGDAQLEMLKKMLQPNLGEELESESAREPFCRSFCKWIDRILPTHAAFQFGRAERDLNSLEREYLHFRGAKDKILCSLVHWRNLFTGGRNDELHRWVARIHMEHTCEEDSVAALGCLSSISVVSDLFPGDLVEYYRTALVRCVDRSYIPLTLRALFPLAKQGEDGGGAQQGGNRKEVVDDYVRDLVVLRRDGNREFEKRINKMTDSDLSTRTQVYEPDPSRKSKLKRLESKKGGGGGSKRGHFEGEEAEEDESTQQRDFVPIQRRFLFEMKSLPELHRETLKEIMFRLANRACKPLREIVLAGQQIPLSMLFESNPDFFCIYTVWYTEFRKIEQSFSKKLFGFFGRKQVSQQEALEQQLVNHISEMILRAFGEFGYSLSKRLVTIGALRECSRVPVLHDAMAAVGSLGSRELIVSLEKEIQESWDKLQNMRKISKKFIPEDPVLKILSEAIDKWEEWRMVDLSYLFRQVKSVPEGPHPPPGPLPEIVVAGLDWMIQMLKSNLFAFSWNEECKSEARLEKFQDVRLLWEEIYTSIINHSISFGRLEVLMPFLDNPEELEILYVSTTGSVKAGSVSWKIRKINEKELGKMKSLVNKFSHLRGVRANLDNIAECLPIFRNWVKDVESLETVQSHVRSLRSLFESRNWDEQRLSDYQAFAGPCEGLHPSLLNLHPALFEKILESPDLLEWLRSQPDDQDFTRGIEMAMGRSEMECPPELWIVESGQAGRVNEGILSKLQSVRTYLHKFIFREDMKFKNMDQFVEKFLSHLGKFEKTTLSQIDTCNEHRLPLVELLSGGTDSAAPDRLLRLLQPISQAQWVCDSKEIQGRQTELQGILRLEYSTRSKDGTRHLSANEVDDFQSSVVLSRTDTRGEETREKISNFVQSFGWMKQYASSLVTLHNMGHFSFDQFSFNIALQTDSEEIRSRALEARKSLVEWEGLVRGSRLKYPSMNNFGMKLIWELAKFLRKKASSNFESMDRSQGLVQKMVSLINPELADQADILSRIENDLLDCWVSLTAGDPPPSDQSKDKDDEDVSLSQPIMDVDEEKGGYHQKEMEIEELLDCCGKTVERVLGKIEPLRRGVVLPEGNYPRNLKSGDLRLITAVSYEAVFQEVLSMYALYNVLPGRRTLGLCREDSTWEEVLLLLLRWSQSQNKEDELFCLANADLLPGEIQVKTVAFIQEVVESSVVPLLLVCGPSRNVYVVSQFINKRIPSYPVARNILQDVVERGYQGRVCCYLSDYAGAGKSFQIRKGRGLGEDYCHVPATACAKFLTRLQERILDKMFASMEMSDPHFHFDLYDTAGVEINSLLFEIIFFFGYCNFSSGMIFCYSPSKTYISVEVPTGPLSKRLIVPKLCPVTKVVAEASLFAPNAKDMKKGMGSAQFYGARYDGTALRKREENIRHANSYERLQYVCTALDILKKTHGKFPYVFETSVVEVEGLLESLRMSASGESALGLSYEGDVDGETCFDLLLHFSDLPPDRVSLWCLWNFINMVYWQLRDMHYPDSPLNGACMPTKQDVGGKVNKKETEEFKMHVKGEILAFILRTAREFATRQSSEIDPEEVTGLEVTGFSRRDFNGKWKKQLYQNDGKPVFSTKGGQNKNFYMYYRAVTSNWVIDDLITSQDESSFSYTTGPEYDSVWKTVGSACWKPNPAIKPQKVHRKEAYQGEALSFQGFSGEHENGVYLRQPPYDDINGRPQYIKVIDEALGKRRHLFFERGQWMICPVCSPDEGCFGFAKANFTGTWLVIPDDVIEKNLVFKTIKAGDEIASSVGSSSKAETLLGGEGDIMVGDEEADQLLVKKDEEFNEFLTLERLFAKMTRWVDSNHECILFSNKNHVVSFLSMNPDVMKKNMHPTLLEFLEHNKMNVGESLDQLSSRHHEVLGALTEMYRSAEEADKLMGGNYVLTGDNLLKMLAIFIRLRVGIPVILMGECGCGKTSLLKYLCSWLEVDLLVLDVHGGTTPDDIAKTFEEADSMRKQSGRFVYVFLDEVNACNHMGLICEVITKRSLHGKPIHDKIYILAALNPYRRRPPQAETFGLVYKHKGGSSLAVQDEMSSLVYRVTPIPSALRDFVFDFGSLEPKQEKMYISSMVTSQLELPSLEDLSHQDALREKAKREGDYKIITSLVVEAQTFVRDKEGDPSSVSLRDVRRFMFFVNFFLGMTTPYNDSVLVSSCIVSLALVYYYRLSREEHREQFWAKVADTENVRREAEKSSFQLQGGEKVKPSSSGKQFSEYFLKVLEEKQNSFCEQLDVGEGIALNNALTENLFVSIVCILNRVPVFLVGKPGTSKTLTMQIIASNLQGKQSPREFWRKFPSVYVFPYQCSPMSDSSSIQHQFHMAMRYQEHANNTITVLLLDEVGLAEHSPEMPLKCLHGMLVDPPIAIVGLSNWVLDPAKMNRAVLVQRPEPSSADISNTGASILGLPPRLANSPLFKVLKQMSRAYFYVYTNQTGRDFIGMRDYYSLIKFVRSYVLSKIGDFEKAEIPRQDIIFAICRNFGGRNDILRDVLAVMCEELFDRPVKQEGDIVELKKEDEKEARRRERRERKEAKRLMKKSGRKGKHGEKAKKEEKKEKKEEKKGDEKKEEEKKEEEKKEEEKKEEKEEKELTIFEMEKKYGFKRPPLSVLIESNLEAHDARHLMLLTKNCAALSLLFSCGLVHRNRTKVIIGSEFSEDDTELYLVQQMNEVKLAMATGKVIVLMNADNMYEALYDVLNQRYLMKKDNATGKVQRLLRLAIGSRSSLCPVEDGFRIIVIAEQEYAYRELDLPLLNRFEKQIMTPSEVLTDVMRKAIERGYRWVDQVQEETGLQSHQNLFCGYHDGTIPSAIFHLGNTLLKEKSKATPEEVKAYLDQEVKRCLKRIAFPAAVALSPSLQKVDEPACHPDFKTGVQEIFRHQRGGLPTVSLVMTYSPVSHLDDQMLESLDGIDVERVRLDEVKSEKAFTALVERYLNDEGVRSSGSGSGSGSGNKKRALVIQFDSIMCSPLQVNHAKFLCTDALARYESQKKKTKKGEKAIVFLVHMPPGVKERARSFVFDFEEPWIYLFLDDLRGLETSVGGGSLDVSTLLHMPLLEFFDKGLANFEEIVNSQLPVAVCRVRVPHPQNSRLAEDILNFANRISTLKGALDEERFKKLFLGTVMSILTAVGGEDGKVKGLYLHTYLAVGEMSCGTLMQSLTRTISELVLQAMVHVLLRLEKNFNLSTLKLSSPLWLTLSENKNVLDLSTLAQVCKLGGRAALKDLMLKSAENTGKGGAFVSSFPFSHEIIKLLQGKETRQAIEAASQGRKEGAEKFVSEMEYIEKIFVGLFGEEVLSLSKSSDKLDYLHDFVAICAPPVDGLSAREIETVHKAVLLAFHPEALSSPPAIHASYRHNEARIQVICSILATVPSETRKHILETLEQVEQSGIETLVEKIFDGVADYIWGRTQNLAFVQRKEGQMITTEQELSAGKNLPSFISGINGDIIDLLSGMKKKKEGGGLSPQQKWRSILVLKIFLEGFTSARRVWGMGESGKNLLKLLHEYDVCSLEFFDDFCLGLAKFYSFLRCCADCGGIWGHSLDPLSRDDAHCPSCKSSYLIRTAAARQKSQGYHHSSSSRALRLPKTFWDDFLASPAEREQKVDPSDSSSSSSSGPEELRIEKGTENKRKDLVRRFLETWFVRFANEILFSGEEGVDEKLIQHISFLTNAPSLQFVSKKVNISEDEQRLIDFVPEPSTRVSLMNILLKAERDLGRSGGKQVELFQISSTIGRQLYLAHRVSVYEQEIEKLGEDIESLQKLVQLTSQKDVDVVLNWGKGEKQKEGEGEGDGDDEQERKRIDSVARLQTVLRRYGRLIGSDHFPPNEVIDTKEYAQFSKFFNNFLTLDSANGLRSYVTKTIKDGVGLDGVLSFLFVCERKGANWVRFDRESLQVVVEDCPIGPLVSKRRKELQDLEPHIKELLRAKGDAVSEKIKTIMGAGFLEEILLPALYNQISHVALSERRNPDVFIGNVQDLAKKLQSSVKEAGRQVLGKVIPLAVDYILLLAYPSLDSKLLSLEIVPCVVDKQEGLTNKSKTLLQLLLRILMGIGIHPDSWLSNLLFEPSKYMQRYFPGSLFEAPLDRLRWYECPNGHPYAVGECGMPMQKGKCPQCGVIIGGEHHRSVAGIKDAAKNPMVDLVNHLGYQFVIRENVRRLNGSTAAFFRLVVDTTLFMSPLLTEKPEDVAMLIRESEVPKVRDRMVRNISQHQQELIEINRVDAMLSGVLVNAVFSLVADEERFWKKGPELEKKENTFKVEQGTDEIVKNVVSDIKNEIQHRVDSSWQATQREKVLMKSLGEEQWDELLESAVGVTEIQMLWRYLPSINMEHFIRSKSAVDKFEEKYPLLNAFLDQEGRLQHVRCIVAILEWHRVLFTVFQNSEISREEADAITNEEVVAKLSTEEERDWGRRVLNDFCDTFQTSFPVFTHPLIYECSANPFTTDTEPPVVDLSGSKGAKIVPMSPKTSIAFSMPRFKKYKDDTIDVHAICTVTLLQHLHRVHERALGIGAARPRRRREGEEEGEEEEEAPAAAAQDNDTNASLPEVTCETPSRTLRQKLIVYDRSAGLMPLLNTYNNLGLEYGASRRTLEYKFREIENQLRFGVLGGKQSIRLYVKTYQYRGEIQGSEGVKALKSRIPQVEVKEAILQLICGEIDTKNRIIRLMSFLEMIIRFITTVGGSGVKGMDVGKTFLRDFALDTLQLDSKDWDEASTPSLDGHIRMCNLRSLFLRLEELINEGQDEFESVLPHYREELSETQKDKLRPIIDQHREGYTKVVLPALTELLKSQLTTSQNMAEFSVQESLSYLIEFEDEDVLQESFPDDEFPCKYALSLYSFIRTVLK